MKKTLHVEIFYMKQEPKLLNIYDKDEDQVPSKVRGLLCCYHQPCKEDIEKESKGKPAILSNITYLREKQI